MKILLTGANGYIGRRLIPVLLEAGHTVVCQVRDPERFQLPEHFAAQVEVVQADWLQPQTHASLPRDIDAAYFLVHSLLDSQGVFARESRLATCFRDYIDTTTAQQVIYLGGIANDRRLSPHLRARLEVERILSQGRVPLTVLRAAIIVGSGSASFEMIRDLVEKLPVMVGPSWLETRCQPIAVRDTLHYLLAVLGREEAYGQTWDIGGPDVLTYRQMLEGYARVRGLTRIIRTLPVNSKWASAQWVNLFSSVSLPLARNLIGSLGNEVVVRNRGIEQLAPEPCIPYEEAVRLALARIRQNEVVSSWKDALLNPTLKTDFSAYLEVPEEGCFKDQQQMVLPDSSWVPQVLDTIWQIGGDRGWYHLNELWKIRGFLDKMIGGVGLRRGRRSPTDLRAGDALDFWRVIVADRAAHRLLLYAEMKLPGEAWLEFRIDPPQKSGARYVLRQTATFRPTGLGGRAYWYSILPIHIFLFRGMIREVVRRSRPVDVSHRLTRPVETSRPVAQPGK